MKSYCLGSFPELFKKDLKIKDIKKKIKELTGIKEENQKFQMSFKFSAQENDENNIWDNLYFSAYDITNYDIWLRKGSQHFRIPLNLNYKIEQLKKTVYEKTKLPIDRMDFFLNDIRLMNDRILNNDNLFQEKLTIKISKLKNDIINLKYPDSKIKQIKTTLCNTGFDLLEEIGWIKL